MPNQSVGAAGEVREQGVRKQGGEDTDGDGELLERGQASADVARRDLGDVGRGDHEARPMPRPPTTRQKIRSHTLKAKPVPMELTEQQLHRSS